MPGRFSRAFRSLAGSGIRKTTSSCRVATELVSDSLNRKLTIRERLRLRLHLMVCGACRNYLSNLKMMGDVLAEPILGDDGRDGLSDDAVERIREKFRNRQGQIDE
ncbi:MAG: hypothetical protein DWQ47_10195 [Acidobacteria bacterium]|nr:MAG: hypothetical protein DWQ32_12610 [Acidobacteriota bacterium]REJ97961.1 MAG: hypothetical protein DWQ38_15410 [Acidobacteriota bacterium]REK16704.1 MAG: hypothetical protein DWQ43_00455 [Acidobacteriota bacterium]REK42615.1 MAG: hypothetical protein DWQ47_10195 [Acidobacteriota bacterium]